MPLHVYIDESIRGKIYFLAAVRIQSADIGWIRTHVANKLRFRGVRVHMHHESESVRKQAVREFCKLPIAVDIVQASIESSTLDARVRALRSLGDEIAIEKCSLIVLENISSDLLDKRILRDLAKNSHHSFPEFRHMTPSQEPLLQLADIAAWSFGRGGQWRQHLAPQVRKVLNA